MTRLLVAALLSALLLVSPAYAGTGTITTKDAGGVTRTFDVITDGSGNFNPTSVLCDQAAAATCASVGTAGSPSTNALTVQSVTLGHGVAANAMRVELPTDGTGTVIANAGTNLNTSALATSANQATNGATTAHTCSTAGFSELGCLGQIDDDVKAAIPAGSAIIGKVGIDQTTPGTTNGVQLNAGTALIGNVGATVTPAGATQITASATGTTAATTATLAGTGGKTTYICSMSVRANATAAVTVTDTITGVITGTLSRTLWVAPLASGLGVDEMVFNPCVAASGTNQAIAVVSGAPGTGGVVSVNATGYQM
jgi:hypothetical protein